MSQPLTWSKQWSWNDPRLTWNGAAPEPTKPMYYHVSLGFVALPGTDLVNFAGGVHDAMVAAVATFASPPVTMAALATAKTNLDTAEFATIKGSVAQTIARDAARLVVVNMLRSLASYVEGIAQGDPAKIRLAGFQPVTHERGPQTVLDKPVILDVSNIASTQLQIRLQAVKHAHSYEVDIAVGEGAWQRGTSGTNSRSLVVQGLNPGTLYKIRARAIGGSTGFSDWSDTVSHWAT